jgi:hypothetical protein
LPGKAGGTYSWQFYLRRATFDPEFSHKLGLLFWDEFAHEWHREPFQLCGCYPSGAPIIASILNTAPVPIRAFLVRRTPKYGMDTWFDGFPGPEPVLMVDDVAASTEFLRHGAARVQAKLGLKLAYKYFTILNKVGTFEQKNQHTSNYIAPLLVAFFTVNDFTLGGCKFRQLHGGDAAVTWKGLIR